MALVLAASAAATDFPIPGRVVVIKDGRLAKLVARPDPNPFTIPLPGGAADPTLNSSQARFFDTGGPGIVTDGLTVGTWSGLGNPPGARGWKYRNIAAPAGGAVKIVVLKPNTIKILAKDDGSVNGPVVATLGVELTTGSDRYCAEFGGTDLKNAPGLVKRTDALAPGVCPAP